MKEFHSEEKRPPNKKKDERGERFEMDTGL